MAKNGTFTSQEVAERLGVHVKTVHKWIQTGTLETAEPVVERIPARITADSVEKAARRLELRRLGLRGEPLRRTHEYLERIHQHYTVANE